MTKQEVLDFLGKVVVARQETLEKETASVDDREYLAWYTGTVDGLDRAVQLLDEEWPNDE